MWLVRTSTCLVDAPLSVIGAPTCLTRAPLGFVDVEHWQKDASASDAGSSLDDEDARQGHVRAPLFVIGAPKRHADAPPSVKSAAVGLAPLREE